MINYYILYLNKFKLRKLNLYISILTIPYIEAVKIVKLIKNVKICIIEIFKTYLLYLNMQKPLNTKHIPINAIVIKIERLI